MKPLLHALVAIVSLLAVSSLIRSLDRWGYYEFSASKMQHLEEVGERYDTLFLGSSRVYRGIKPSVFDAVVAANGGESRSFNVAIPGAMGHEMSGVLHDLFATLPQLPKRIVIEVVHWEPRIKEANLMSDRVLLWHSWRETVSALQSLQLHMPSPTQLSTREKLTLAWQHVEHFVRRTFRVGRGPTMARAWWEGPDPKRSERALARNRGWNGYNMKKARYQERAKVFQDKYAEFYFQVAVRQARNPVPAHTHELNWSAMEDQIAFVREHGVELVYLIAPAARPRIADDELARLRSMADVLDYSDPETCPELFDPSVRFDWLHLNALGAEVFSRRLAHDLQNLSARPPSRRK